MSVSLIDGRIDDDVLTDEQIIKALECCIEGYCPDCFYGNTDQRHCKDDLMQNAIDIINRQKANAEGLTNAVKYLNEQVSSARAEAVNEFSEKLKMKFSCIEYVIKTSRKTMPVERVKTEVDAVLQNGCLNIIDKTLKEVTGDTQCEQ